MSYFNRFQEVVAVYSTLEKVDEDLNPIKTTSGMRPNTFSIFTLGDYCKYEIWDLLGPSRAIRKKVVQAFPPQKY